MAILNRIDEDETASRLRDWLAAKYPESEQVTVSGLEIPPGNGMSMTTALFTASWVQDGTPGERQLVARIQPFGPGLFMEPDVAREAKVIRALDGSIKVPTLRWLEEDPAVLGAPFLVVDRAFGRVPGDDPPYSTGGWVLDLPPAERGKLHEGALDVLSRLHALDWRDLDLGFLDRPSYGPTGLQQEIAYWEKVYEWAHEGGPSSTLDAVFEWVKANRPDEDEFVLNWGDPRIGNIIFGDDLSVQAVLDWEMAGIASPEQDIGWFSFLVRFYSEGIGVPVPDGMQTIEELHARYQELSGRVLRHPHYYEVFAGLRLNIVLMRFANHMIAAGALPADDPMPYNNPASQLLARLTDLPAPEGDSSYFVGKR